MLHEEAYDTVQCCVMEAGYICDNMASLYGPNISSNMSDICLEFLNADRAKNFIPSIAYLVVAVAIGLPGNTVILLVYRRYFPKTAANWFLTGLALSDLVICFAVPHEILDMMFPYTYADQLIIPCKISRYILRTCIGLSVFIRVAVGYERYQKICHPLRNFSSGKARKLMLAGTIYFAFQAGPGLFLDVIEEAETKYRWLRGRNCLFNVTVGFAKIYLFFVSFVLFAEVVIAMVLYTTVFITLLWREKCLESEKFRLQNKISIIGSYTESSSRKGNKNYNSSHHSSAKHGSGHADTNTRHMSCRTGGARLKMKKLTVMVVMGTGVSCIVFLPLFIAYVLELTTAVKQRRMFDDVLDGVLEFCARVWATIAFINPIVYICMDVRFRRALAVLFRRTRL